MSRDRAPLLPGIEAANAGFLASYRPSHAKLSRIAPFTGTDWLAVEEPPHELPCIVCDQDFASCRPGLQCYCQVRCRADRYLAPLDSSALLVLNHNQTRQMPIPTEISENGGRSFCAECCFDGKRGAHRVFSVVLRDDRVSEIDVYAISKELSGVAF